MRYHLRCADLEAEVQVAGRSGNGPGSDLSITLRSDEGSVVREVMASADLIQVREPDGSHRRLAYSPEQIGPDSITFFHAGRVREVTAVGGVGGRVESGASEGTVVAPMNGQVVKTLAQVGQAVQSGEIVLILEAMKMENEVTAPLSGTVGALHVTPGDTVSPGQVLFTIEASE